MRKINKKRKKEWLFSINVICFEKKGKENNNNYNNDNRELKKIEGAFGEGTLTFAWKRKKRKYKVEKRRGNIRRLDIPICARLIEKTSSKEKSSFRPMPRFALWSLYRQFYGILIIIIIIHKRSLYKNSLDGRQSNDAFLESPSPSKKLMIPDANETRFLSFFFNL